MGGNVKTQNKWRQNECLVILILSANHENKNVTGYLHVSSLRMKSALSTKIRECFITIKWQPVWLKIGAHPSVI
jgi:hypothetical protein